MKRQRLTTTLLMTGFMSTAFNSTLVYAQPPEPEVGKRWALNAQYSDEFNGTTLDRTKWRNYHSTWKGREPAKFDPAAVSVKSGNMQIENHKLATPDGEYTMAAGAVQSIKKTAYHGYYEARFKSSRINMSTTFWLSNSNVDLTSPNNLNVDCDNDKWSMELDIAETVGGVIDKAWGEDFRNGQQYNVHVWYSNCDGERSSFAKGVNAAEGDGSTPANNKLANGEEVWQDFNTYAAWWKDENEVNFYLNDNFAGKIHVSTALHDKPYSRPMGMQMLTETYNWATPYPSDSELADSAINTSYYDWVRSYVYVDIDEDLPEPETGLITNAGFESGDLTDWIGWGGSPREVVKQQAKSGLYAGHVVGGGAIERAVSLLPNTDYTFNAQAHVIAGNLIMGAKTTTGTEVTLATVSQAVTGAYQNVELSFNTGSHENIKLYLYAQNGSEFYVDDTLLTQVNPKPVPVDNSPAQIYAENVVIKNQDLTSDKLALAFLYQINQDRDADIVVYDGDTTIINKKIRLKAGYGHLQTDVDFTALGTLSEPQFEVNLMPVDEVMVINSTGKITLESNIIPPVETTPIVTLNKQSIARNDFKSGEGEQVVLKARLNSDVTGAQLNSLSFKAQGDINEKTDVKAVKLYQDTNANGVVDAGELLATGEYSADNTSVIFDLSTALILPAGDTTILLTYTF